MIVNRLYLSGPMTGIEDHNIPAFMRAALELAELGYKVANPADVGTGKPGLSWEDYLRIDLRLLLDCQGVAVLPGWVGSRGASLEVHVARRLSMPVRPVHEWPRRNILSTEHAAGVR